MFILGFYAVCGLSFWSSYTFYKYGEIGYSICMMANGIAFLFMIIFNNKTIEKQRTKQPADIRLDDQISIKSIEFADMKK